MTTKTFSIHLKGSDTKYLVICQNGTSQDTLLENLKDCSNCEITDYDNTSSHVSDLKAIGAIYERLVKPPTHH